MPEAKPFIVGIWSGEGKPKYLSEFLNHLVDELNYFYQNGPITLNGHQISLKVRSFICDTPARCYLKGIHI